MVRLACDWIITLGRKKEELYLDHLKMITVSLCLYLFLIYKTEVESQVHKKKNYGYQLGKECGRNELGDWN